MEMLFNATQSAELRIATVDRRLLCNLLVGHANDGQKANIYKGIVTRIEPSLEAAFVNYGKERHGFLPLKEIAYSLGHTQPEQSDSQRLHIRDLLKEGQEILVQVDKEERGNKGAALSTFISLAGSYLVLMPNSPKAGGVSRRIEGEDRQGVKEALAQLTVPDDMGVIVRTAGVGRSIEELQWDLNYLLKLWDTIKQTAESPINKAPYLVYQESDVILRSLRDYMRPEISEIIIDEETTYNKIRQHMSMFRPDFVDRVRFYQDTIPLFTRYQIESQIESVYLRNIRLPSGGSIVIDRAEALVAIDVNSAQATKGGDIEETAFNTNLEAADEIARQLRLRDLGGLIVVDFIDMSSNRHQREVEERMTQAITHDRARIQLGRISRFGLLEMSRQRLRSAVGESVMELCPRCHGRGTIRDVESLAISVLRLVEENAAKEGSGQVHAQVPVEVATYLLNEKRREIAEMETKHKVLIFIIPNPHLQTPDFEVARFKQTANMPSSSYNLISEAKKVEMAPVLKSPDEEKIAPAVKDVLPEMPAPIVQKAKHRSKSNLFNRLLKYFRSKKEEKPTETPQRRHSPHAKRDQSEGYSNRQGAQRGGNRNQQNRSRTNPNQNRSRTPDNKRGPGRNPNYNAQEPRAPRHQNQQGTTGNRSPRRELRADKPEPISSVPIIEKPVAPPPVMTAPPPVVNPVAAPTHIPHTPAVSRPPEAPAKPKQTYVRKPSADNFMQVETQASSPASMTQVEKKRVRPTRPAHPKVKQDEPLVMIETQRKEDDN